MGPSRQKSGLGEQRESVGPPTNTQDSYGRQGGHQAPVRSYSAIPVLNFHLKLKPAESRKFADFLAAEVLLLGGAYSDGDHTEDGHLEERVIVSLGNDRRKELELKLLWASDASILSISAIGRGFSDENWTRLAKDRIDNALAAALSEELETHFITQRFAFLGRALDGEYYFPGIRIAPALDETAATICERIVTISLYAEGVDEHHAQRVGTLAAERVASLLSVLIPAGIYRIPYEHRWVILDQEEHQCERRQLGFVSPTPAQTEMPKAGELFRQGRFHDVDRKVLTYPIHTGNTLTLPKDIGELFRCFAELPKSEKKAFQGAANLFRIARTVGRYYPTVEMSYCVAAVDALLKKSSCKAFTDLVMSLCSGVNRKRVKESYGRVRSGHFHSGSFPGGEFELSPVLFGGPIPLERLNRHHYICTVMWNCLIRWLLARSTQ